MQHGGTFRSPSISTRAWRGVALVLVTAALVSACGTSGGDRAAPAETTTTERQAAGGEKVACADLNPATWSAAPTDADLPFQIAAGKAPALGGATPTTPQTSAVFKTADAFLAQSNVPDPEARKKVMERAAFRGGAKGEWPPPGGSTMQALTFADARSAATYVQARLASVCGQGGTQGGVTMLSDGDGITWTDPLGATHGEFIFGGSQVSLTSCGGCDSVSLDEMQAWHDAFVDAYATGPAAPIS